ncbi:hypothetical protein EV179_001356 [Coemansia sp. RSA 487]|nr:hypothetical protein LPJ74_001776 [Coemansia sp. RSA 1843]KAJ2216331.1 hypothetical protein EV179_001356 [Coemansia sp. RSA 487]
MSGTDDFQYDSVVSDPGVYDGILGSAGDVREGTATGTSDRTGAENSNNMLTPSTHRAETPPPFTSGGPSDSIPSLADSSDRLQLEFDHERHDNSNLHGSQQSQYGMKSGMYTNGSTTDFMAKLKGDVVVSGRWSTIGEQGYSEEDHEYNNGRAAEDKEMPHSNASSKPPMQSSTTEVAAEFTPFNKKRYSTESLISAPKSDAGQSGASSAIQTPKMTRTRSDQYGMPGGLEPTGEPQVPRSALRGSRPSSQHAEDQNIGSNSVPPSPRTVSFAGLDPLSASEASLHEFKDKEPAMSSSNSTAHESIVFHSQTLGTHQTRGSSSGNDGDDMSTQPLQDDNGDPDVEDMYQQKRDGSDDRQGNEKARFSPAVSIGVGMAGGVFRKFAGWTQQLSQPRPSSAVAAGMPSLGHSKDSKPTESMDGRRNITDAEQEGDARAGSDGAHRSTAGKNESAMETRTSSLSTTSSLSSVQTEPMRSHIFSNMTTPNSAIRTGVPKPGSPYTTPMRRPSSSRKTPNTSSRSVNPLARHLAMKAILSVPSSQRGAIHGSSSSSGLTPTHTDKNGVALPLVAEHQSMSADGSEYDPSNNSAIHNLDEIQKQFDIFASQLKHDASAAQADIHESETAWNELQYELHQLKTQLLDAETTRDFYHRQAEESEKYRFEWEQDRQNLVDENNELQSNIEQWRQRIGDVENERQGIWKEGTQSREQLLHTIARLETDLSESRADTSRIKVSLASATVEFDEKFAKVLAERDELYDNINEVIPNCEQLKEENQHMQADLYEALHELDYNRKILDQREVELQRAIEEKAMLARSLDDARTKTRLVESHHNEAVAHIGQLEKKLDEMAHTAMDSGKRESELQAEVASLKEAKELLQETLENVTEQNRELKDSHDESRFFKTALNEEDVPDAQKHEVTENTPATGSTGSADSDAVFRLKAEHRDTLESMKKDYDLLVESMESITESKNRYKAENAELTKMAESARDEIESLKKQLLQVKSSISGTSSDLELEQLRESEGRLKRELDGAERERKSITERMRGLDERNKQLALRNDDLSQLTARLETELSDLQMGSDRRIPKSENGTDKETEEELGLLHQTVSDLRHALSQKDGENDKLRQANANMDTELDDVRMELYKARNKLSSEKDTLISEMEKTKSLQQANDKLASEISDLQGKLSVLGGKYPSLQSPDAPSPGTANSPSMEQIDKLTARKFGLSQTVRELRADVNALEQSFQQMSDRRDKIEKEQRYLAEEMRDTLLANRSLRNQLTEFLLRRAGKLRELQVFRNMDNGNESFLNPDDANISIMSGTVDMVPSTSQLLDNKNNGKFFKSLDKHLDMMGNIIDEVDSQAQAPPSGSAVPNSPKRGDNQHQPLSGRLQKKVLTPIREEFGAQPSSHSTQDASMQCDGFLSGDIDRVKKQLEDSLEAAREQTFLAEEDCRTLRATVANVKQERDQFKASQEEAAERVGKLTGQIEELSEDHERMKAVNMTTARISLRVNRQLVVLKKALSRLEPRETRGVDSNKDDPQLSQIEAEEKEDALIMEEDDEMMQATIDHPLRKSDLELLGIVDFNIVGSGDTPASPYPDGIELYDKINNDEVLEQVGLAVSKAYAEVKRIRSGVIRVKRERARLMKRLAEVERSKLPSYELSTQWGRKLRSRSYAEDLAPSSTDANGGSNADGAKVSDQSDDVNSRQELQGEDGLFGHHGEHEEASEAFGGDGTQGLDMSVLQGPIAAAAEISRLTVQLKKKDHRLRFVEKDRDKLDEFNHELVQKLDRAYAEKLRAQQECNAMTLRAQSRAAASRATTPSRSTDWDDFDSIQQEMQRCKSRNREYFTNVEKLCHILNQHTLDRALADYDDSAQAPSGSSENVAKTSQMDNVYRTLLMDMALVLDAKGDLDEKKSIRENFNSMAAAVRKRLDSKEAELKSIRSKLEASRLAGEAAANASVLSAKATSTTEERMRNAERRATELETQIAESQEQITTYQTNVRSLNETISRLRQQCVAADSELQDARLERDGWNQQCIANQQSLGYQIDENNQLKKKLDQLAQLRSRNTKKFVEGGRLGYDDRTTSLEWEQQLREEWTEATREETKQVWLSEVFALRQTYEAQIKIYSWANMLWGDIISSFVSQAMRDVESNPDGFGADPNSAARGLSGSASALKSSGESLLQATDDLNDEIDMAVKRAVSMQDNMRTPNGMNSYQDTSKRTRLVDELNSIVQDLKRDFSGTWRENVRECIVTVAAGLVGLTRHVQLVSSGGYANITPTSANSGSSSSGQPQLTSEQKAKIRKHHDKKMADLQRQLGDKLQEERTKNKTREREIKAKHRKDMQMVIAEKQYYRGRLNIMHDRHNFMKCQKRIMLKMAGGQDALLERVDKIAYQQRMREQSPSSSSEERRERIRSLWCRVLLAVRLCNGLYGMYIKGKEVNAIKENVLSQVSDAPANGNKAVQIKWSQPQQSQQQQEAEPPRAWPELDHGSSNGNYVTAYHRNKIQRYVGLNTAPIKSSNLRNRSSDLRSSTGSSMN